MSFRRSNVGGRNRPKDRRPAWQVKHVHVSVQKASYPNKASNKQQPSLPSSSTSPTRLSSATSAIAATSSVPSYSLGSTSNPKNFNNKVIRHHAVSLSQHDSRRVQMAHNGPIPAHKSIASPRHKARQSSVGFKPSTFSTVRPSTSPLSEPTSYNTMSAGARARARQHQMALEKRDRDEHNAQFKANLKKRLSNKVQSQRKEAEKRKQAWSSLEEKSRKNAADWVAGDADPNIVVDEDTSENDSMAHPCDLQSHLLNITAQSNRARAALFSRSRATTATTAAAAANRTNEVGGTNDDAAWATEVADAVLQDISAGAEWQPNLSLLFGEVNKNFIDQQSQSHLRDAVRRSESKAQRAHAQRYRKEMQLKKRVARKEREKEKMHALQDMRVEESRMAHEKAREEYELFLNQAETGVDELKKSSMKREMLEENVASRYFVALRQNLLTKLNKQGLHVPTICSCVPPEGEIG